MPDSTISPSLTTRILSALRIVESRWAIISVVHLAIEHEPTLTAVVDQDGNTTYKITYVPSIGSIIGQSDILLNVDAAQQIDEDDATPAPRGIEISADQGGAVEASTGETVMIGAGAAMLCHGRRDWEWPHVRDIVVHPTQWNEDGEPGDHHGIAGQVHLQGPVLFSRKQIRFGFRKPDGENVVLHELAHVLDMADGSADGSPDRFAWTAVPGWDDMVRSRLKAVRKRQAGPLRAYAGTNSAELFAVAVEVFFEQPARLRKQDPNLYEALATLFNLDPDTGALRQPLPG